MTKSTQSAIDAGLVALRTYLPGEHDEDPRIVVAIYEAMRRHMVVAEFNAAQRQRRVKQDVQDGRRT